MWERDHLQLDLLTSLSFLVRGDNDREVDRGRVTQVGEGTGAVCLGVIEFLLCLRALQVGLTHSCDCQEHIYLNMKQCASLIRVLRV